MRVRKLLKYFLISTGVLVVIAFLAFCTFIYNPFEGRLAVLRKAVPRNIDFYIGKRSLRGDFEDFPRPWFWVDVEEGTALTRIRGTRFVRKEAEQQVRQAVAEIGRMKSELAAIPVVGVDILGDVIGEDLVVAGRFAEPTGHVEWCAYSRIGWKIRAAIGGLDYEWGRSMAQGVRITPESPEDGIFRIETPRASAVFLARYLDVAIVGSTKEFVEESCNLAKGPSTTEPFVASSGYQDHVVRRLDDWRKNTGDAGNALEFFGNIEKLRRIHPDIESWPGPDQEIGLEARLFKSFVNLKSMRRLWGGTIFHGREGTDYDGGIVSTLLHLVMNRKELTDFQGRFLGERHGEVSEWLRPLLTNVPGSAAALVVIRVPATPFVLECIQALEPAERELADEQLRSIGQRGGLRGLAMRLAPAFEPFVAVVFRLNKFPKPVGEQLVIQNPAPVPAWAWIFKVVPKQKHKVAEFVKLLREHYKTFGLTNLYVLREESELEIIELANPQLPGTGEFALLDGSDHLGGYFLFSNSGSMLSEIIATSFRRYPSVLQDDRLREVLAGLPRALSGFAWCQGTGVRDIVIKFRDFAREELESDRPDQGWMLQKRPGLRTEVFNRDYRGRYPDMRQLKRNRRDWDELEKKVDAELRHRWQSARESWSRQQLLFYDELLAYLTVLDKAYVVMQTGSRDLSFEARTYLTY